MNWDNQYREWYEFHREDYAAAKRRLRATRNVVLRGRFDAAVRVLKKACVNAVLSIQTPRDRHERAFTAYFATRPHELRQSRDSESGVGNYAASGVRLEEATGMTVYGNQKAQWLRDALANFDYAECVHRLRMGNVKNAHEYVAEEHTGLSWTKAGFALAMCGVWEVACPDSRTRQELGIDGRIRTVDDYQDALQRIDDAVPIDEPLFIKQWTIYDFKAGEHARHMPFFREALGPTVV